MDESLRAFAAEAGRTVLAVALVGALLFAASGVWPPMVAVESPSMTPHMQRGDLVVVSEPARFGAGAHAGVRPTADAPARTRTFGAPGDVIVFTTPARDAAGLSPIIHRARLYVEAGENWYGRANRSYLPAGADSCAEVPHCPAPHAGFVTKGDANPHYDQVNGNAPVVSPSRVRAEAQVRIPYLGYVRLLLTGG